MKSKYDFAPHCGNPPKNNFWNFIYYLLDKIKAFFIRKKSPKSEILKVAFIGPYGVQCGISTYNEDLLAELRKIVDIKVFAEYAYSSDSSDLESDPSWVIRCWNRHVHPKKELIKQIKEYDPDIVHISHEYGYFVKAYYFTSLVSTLKVLNYKIVSTMHSVYDHIDKLVSEACIPNLIVHSESAKNVLISKGIKIENIHVIPHGMSVFAGTDDKPELMPHLWNTWASEYTIFQPGFLFDYKGHMRMLHILSRLREKFPDIHYIIQASENPNAINEHNTLYNRFIAKAEQLDLLDNITINRGFVEQSVLLSFICTVKCCVLPYQMHPDHDVRGTSGIARLILATETPLIISNSHLFDDIPDNIALKTSDNEELYNAIEKVFTDKTISKEERKAREEMIRTNSWAEIANQTYETYINCH